MKYFFKIFNPKEGRKRYWKEKQSTNQPTDQPTNNSNNNKPGWDKIEN